MVLREKQIRTIDWPIPDLSPIENIWTIIKNKILNWASEITKWEELIRMIEDIFWRHKTIIDAIKNCYDSLPYRI